MMLYKVLSRLDKSYYSSIVISITDDNYFEENLKSINIPVVYLKMTRAPISIIRGLKILYNCCQKFQPNIIQGWMYHGNLLATLYGKITINNRFRVIWNIRHCVYDLKYEKKITNIFIRLGAYLSIFPDKIIYNSKISLYQHNKLGYCQKRTSIIPNGFDMEKFNSNKHYYISVRNELGLSSGALIVGLIARFHPMKDHFTFLKSAAQISRKLSGVYFVLTGKDVNKNNILLSNFIKKQGLSEKVYLLDERNDIPRLIASFDILALSSITEAFPNVIGEAMSSCVPCVATDVGDVKWIIKHTGIIVPKNNALALANGIDTILALRAKDRINLGKRARSRVSDKFEIENIIKKYQLEYMS